MYNQAYSQVGYSQQEYYILRGSYKPVIALESSVEGLRGVLGVVNVNKDVNHYESPYSLYGYSRSLSINYDDTFKGYIDFDSTYEGYRYLFETFSANIDISSTHNNEVFDIVEDSYLSQIDLNSDYSPLNIVLGEGQGNILFDSQFNQLLRLISSRIKRDFKYNNYNKPYSQINYSKGKQSYRTYNSVGDIKLKSNYSSFIRTEDTFISNITLNVTYKPYGLVKGFFKPDIQILSNYNSENFDIVEDISQGYIVLESVYLPYVPGRMVFKGRLFSQDIDQGTI